MNEPLQMDPIGWIRQPGSDLPIGKDCAAPVGRSGPAPFARIAQCHVPGPLDRRGMPMPDGV